MRKERPRTRRSTPADIDGFFFSQLPNSPAARVRNKKQERFNLVLDAIRSFGPLSRMEIATQLGFNIRTITATVDELVREGLLVEDESKKAVIGRPPVPVSLNARAMAVLGIEIGIDYTIGVIMDFAGGILFRKECTTPQWTRPEEHAVHLKAFAQEMVEERRRKSPPLRGIGIALPGLYYSFDRTGRRIYDHIEAMRRTLQVSLGLPVFLEGDSRMLALGEMWFGPAVSFSDYAVVNISHGLAMGSIEEHRLYRGSQGHAGDLGHVKMGDPDVTCFCGGRGCLENVASISGIERMAAQAGILKGGLPAKADDVAELARDGNAMALEVFQRFSAGLARGLGAVINLTNPQAIVLSGRGSRYADVFEMNLVQELATQTLPAYLSSVSVLVSKLHESAVSVGTCACVLQQLFPTSVPRHRS